MTRLARKLEVDEARDAVVEAARAWYAGRGNVEAPLAAAVVRLSEAEGALQKRLERAARTPLARVIDEAAARFDALPIDRASVEARRELEATRINSMTGEPCGPDDPQGYTNGRDVAPGWMPERAPVDGSAPACVLHTGLTLRETAETPGAVDDLAAQLAGALED